MDISYEQIIPALQARIGGDAVVIAGQQFAIESLEADNAKLTARIAELEDPQEVKPNGGSN